MTYNANVKFCYVNDSDFAHRSGLSEIVDKQTITIEAPAHELNIYQYFDLFKSFVRAVGFTDYNIMDAACAIAFNDMNDKDQMRRIATEYDLVLAEDQKEKLEEYDKQQDEELKKLEAEVRCLKEKLSWYVSSDWKQPSEKEPEEKAVTNEILDLKAKLSRLQNPAYLHYTEEELDAMLTERSALGLRP